MEESTWLANEVRLGTGQIKLAFEEATGHDLSQWVSTYQLEDTLWRDYLDNGNNLPDDADCYALVLCSLSRKTKPVATKFQHTFALMGSALPVKLPAQQ